MKNVEKYKGLIAKTMKMYCINKTGVCSSCELKNVCNKEPSVIEDWLFQEYVPPTEITETEKIILSTIKHKYNWIARDDDNGLYVYKDKPMREDGFWYGSAVGFNPFNHMFKFIKMDDEEPYNIGGLLRND